MLFRLMALATALVIVPEYDAAPASVACRGELTGAVLSTTATFQDGSRVVGPWRIVGERHAPGGEQRELAAMLDRVIEVDGSTGTRRTTPFPQRIAVTFAGENEQQLVAEAARIWCSTVGKARNMDLEAPHLRIAATEHARLQRA